MILKCVRDMADYRTRQRDEVLGYMRRHSERAMTAAELADALRREGGDAAPGKSTVYRLLCRLADQGLIKRLPRAGARAQAYQMDGHQSCGDSLHLKCVRCGRLTHLTHEQTAPLAGMLRQSHSFDIDEAQTTLYGRCAQCDHQQGGRHGQ